MREITKKCSVQGAQILKNLKKCSVKSDLFWLKSKKVLSQFILHGAQITPILKKFLETIL